MKLAIVIPAHNEESTLKNVLDSIPSAIFGVDEISTIVVNDGSKDNTQKIAAENADYALKHIVNQGLGAALISGFRLAQKIDCDAVVTMDADGQHSTEDIEKILLPIIEGSADIVIGSRMKDAKSMPALKVFGNWFMNFLTCLVFQKWVTDSQSGMRAISRKAINEMDLHSIKYEISSEIIGEAKRKKFTLVEIPIKTIYSTYSMAKGQDFINGINILTRLVSIKMAQKR